MHACLRQTSYLFIGRRGVILVDDALFHVVRGELGTYTADDSRNKGASCAEPYSDVSVDVHTRIVLGIRLRCR